MQKLGLEKTQEPEIKLLTSARSQRKQGNSRKTSTSSSLTKQKPLTVWIITNCGKFLKRWEHQTTLPAFCKTCMQVKKQQRTSLKLGKEQVKAAYCHLTYLISMQSTSCKMPCSMNHKLESRLPGEISTTLDMQIIPLQSRK